MDSREVLKILLSLAVLFCNALWFWETDLTVSDDSRVQWLGAAAAANIAAVRSLPLVRAIDGGNQAASCRVLSDAGIDKADAQRRFLTLTHDGQSDVFKLSPTWQALSDSAAEFNNEAGDLARLLDRLEDALDERSLFERTANRVGSS